MCNLSTDELPDSSGICSMSQCLRVCIMTAKYENMVTLHIKVT